MFDNTCRFPKPIALAVVSLLIVMMAIATGCGRKAPPVSSRVAPAAQASAPHESTASAPQPTSTPAPSPAQLVSRSPAAIAYPADVEAAEEVKVVFPAPGRVQEVKADVGDHVKAGQVLATLDHRALDAQVAQMEAALKAANAQLALLQSPPDEADLAAARASVDAAQKAYNRLVAGPTEEDLIQAKAAVDRAEAALRQAQAAYDEIAGLPNAALMPQALALQQATIGYQAAKATYDKIAKGATADQLAQAYAGLLKAKAGLKKLREGPKPEQLVAAAAQVLRAQAALDAMKVQRDNAYLRAPMDGIVSARRVVTGAYASPAVAAFTLVSTKTKIVFDADVSIARTMRVGQKVNIQIASVADKTFKGRVIRIAPTVDTRTRTQQITVQPLDGAALLRPGMFATVSIREEG
jgi:HlyD family secretion protein